ncbi:hypothetical protein ACHHYP_17289 [Achlya hypogyna]|uniref:Wings apart-like protein C-terminal domain-containing protein n=1 Tax=Achlya hypogyna TaxID=1202772 RepID=A0A1V9Y4R2_ACHHY|nr:hypothetical protein ACHHYP_17289 [Achlya hypogyna]
MQTSALLQHGGGEAAAAAQIEYLIQGMEEGVTMDARARSASQLAAICSNDDNGNVNCPATNAAINGRFLLRAQGGLIDCMRLVEGLNLDPSGEGHTLAYSMMALLYFVTLDHENADTVTTPALRVVIQILHQAEEGYWTATETPSPPQTLENDRPRALTKKKKKAPSVAVAVVADLQALLRREPAFAGITTVSLSDLTLSILYNTLLDSSKHQYGTAPSTKSDRLVGRKKLLRDTLCLDRVARDATSPLRLRLLEQASYLDDASQSHLVHHTPVLVTLFQDVLRRDLRLDAERDTIVMALRVVINLTHRSDAATACIASLHGTNALLALFFVAEASRAKWAFDALLVTLSALVNCVEHDAANRADVAAATAPDGFPALQCMVQFLVRHQGGDTEAVLLGGSAALLLGCLVRSHPCATEAVLTALPERSVAPLLTALQLFVQLHRQIGALSHEVLASCGQVEADIKALVGDCTPSQLASPLDDAVAPIFAALVTPSPPPALSRAPRVPVGPSTPPADAFEFSWPGVAKTTPRPRSKRPRSATPSPLTALTPDVEFDASFEPWRQRRPSTRRPRQSKLTPSPVQPLLQVEKSRSKCALERKSTTKPRRPQCLLDVFDFNE